MQWHDPYKTAGVVPVFPPHSHAHAPHVSWAPDGSMISQQETDPSDPSAKMPIFHPSTHQAGSAMHAFGMYQPAMPTTVQTSSAGRRIPHHAIDLNQPAMRRHGMGRRDAESEAGSEDGSASGSKGSPLAALDAVAQHLAEGGNAKNLGGGLARGVSPNVSPAMSPDTRLAINDLSNENSMLKARLKFAVKEVSRLQEQVWKHLGSSKSLRPQEGLKGQTRYWTAEEHQRFVDAIGLYGPKDVHQIANFVGTRNATQVRTHAQKYFLKISRESKARQGPALGWGLGGDLRDFSHAKAGQHDMGMAPPMGPMMGGAQFAGPGFRGSWMGQHGDMWRLQQARQEWDWAGGGQEAHHAQAFGPAMANASKGSGYDSSGADSSGVDDYSQPGSRKRSIDHVSDGNAEVLAYRVRRASRLGQGG